MARKKNTINIQHYKNKREMNIGIFIFALIFIYLIITIFTYATSKRISIYEVRKGSIVKDNSYTGLIMREEQVVNADSDGYVNYFQNERSKLRAGCNVYVLSSQQLNTSTGELNPVDVTQLNDEEQHNMYLKIQSFNENYSPEKFSFVYSLKEEIDSTIQSATNQTKTAQLDTVIAQSSNIIQVNTSARDGLLVLNTDGYESLTKENLTKDLFNRDHYEQSLFTDQMKVKAGEPVYKLITSENWTTYIQLDKATAASLSDITAIKTRIDKDNETIWADFSILQIDNDYYGCLNYDNSMIRYSEDRFLNVELILEDQSGLKIPKSAVIEKLFYTIPEEYLTTSGNHSALGVMVKEGGETKYQDLDIYYTAEDKTVYVSPDTFTPGTTLIKPGIAGDTDSYQIGDKKSLKGVFCINTGYAVFKQVTILCENDDYYIVEAGTSYGLSNYDHIVQDGTSVQENEVVFQ